MFSAGAVAVGKFNMYTTCVCSFGVMPLEVTPSPGAPPSSALNSVNSLVCASPAVSAQFKVSIRFLQHATKLALQTLYVLPHIIIKDIYKVQDCLRGHKCIISVMSVCLSVRHTPVLCQNDGTQRDAVFTVG